MKKIFSLFAKYLKTLVPRIGRNPIFRLLKCGKFFHTKLVICGKFDNTKFGILATWISLQGKTHFQASKITKISTLCEVPWNVGFTNRQKSHFQAAKMRKNW